MTLLKYLFTENLVNQKLGIEERVVVHPRTVSRLTDDRNRFDWKKGPTISQIYEKRENYIYWLKKKKKGRGFHAPDWSPRRTRV